MITEQQQQEIESHYRERDFTLPTAQRIQELEAENADLREKCSVLKEAHDMLVSKILIGRHHLHSALRILE